MVRVQGSLKAASLREFELLGTGEEKPSPQLLEKLAACCQVCVGCGTVSQPLLHGREAVNKGKYGGLCLSNADCSCCMNLIMAVHMPSAQAAVTWPYMGWGCTLCAFRYLAHCVCKAFFEQHIQRHVLRGHCKAGSCMAL